jgi:hypothetical protein
MKVPKNNMQTHKHLQMELDDVGYQFDLVTIVMALHGLDEFFNGVSNMCARQTSEGAEGLSREQT